jgi:hypothetical protein
MADVERQVRRLLAKLAAGARLVRSGESYLLVGAHGPRQLFSAALVEALRGRGLVRDENGALVYGADDGNALGEENVFAAQHRVLDARLVQDERGRDCYVVVNAAESPMTLLRRRGLITAVQFEAGEKLRRDFTIAQLTPRMSVDYSAPVGSRTHRSPDIAETALAARQRFNRAMHAAGPGLSDVLFDVCCYLRGLDESERARNWPRASAKVVLRIALDRLAEHYGMSVSVRRRMRAWSKEEGEGP